MRVQGIKQMVIASMDARPCQRLIAQGRFEEEEASYFDDRRSPRARYFD